jgi:hypothetical protein
MEEILRQVGHLPELYEEARSEKFIKKHLMEKKNCGVCGYQLA